MAVIRKQSKYSVVEAAKQRVRNIFSNGVPVYMAFSGGKDSLALSNIVYELLENNEIDPKLLTVRFIDEEGIFPDIERKVKEWRKKFIMQGVKFEWYCIEVIHFNALNALQSDETFVCWDRYKKDVWIRPMPKFAITDHPLLEKRQENYQSFMDKISKGGITIIGNRVYESIQRLQNFSKQKQVQRLHPIYDWRDTDVWKYLQDVGEKIPEIYLYLWQVGVQRRNLRVSQFFSSDTIGVLVNMAEYYPDLMERVTRREPNAYLVSMYWDSEMFGRSTSNRRKQEKGNVEKVDYKKKLSELLRDIKGNFNTPHSRKVAKDYRGVMINADGVADEKDYKKMYEALLAGDPKKRTMRSIINGIYSKGR